MFLTKGSNAVGWYVPVCCCARWTTGCRTCQRHWVLQQLLRWTGRSYLRWRGRLRSTQFSKSSKLFQPPPCSALGSTCYVNVRTQTITTANQRVHIIYNNKVERKEKQDDDDSNSFWHNKRTLICPYINIEEETQKTKPFVHWWNLRGGLHSAHTQHTHCHHIYTIPCIMYILFFC